jgi:7-carboxy-7-deazaguanine synthase
MSIDEIVDEVATYGTPLVEITGGEPLLQREVYPLMERLLERGHGVLLETGGHIALDDVPDPVVAIVDVKCPGSGEAGHMHWPNLEQLSPHDEVKFVIADRADFDYAADVVGRFTLAERAAAVLFSPVHGELEPATLAAWILEARLPVRLQIQAHKYIWSPDARGV